MGLEVKRDGQVLVCVCANVGGYLSHLNELKGKNTKEKIMVQI